MLLRLPSRSAANQPLSLSLLCSLAIFSKNALEATEIEQPASARLLDENPMLDASVTLPAGVYMLYRESSAQKKKKKNTARACGLL
jgi:hypothetical protein